MHRANVAEEHGVVTALEQIREDLRHVPVDLQLPKSHQQGTNEFVLTKSHIKSCARPEPSDYSADVIPDLSFPACICTCM